MKKAPTYNEYHDLMTTYLSGNASDAEVQQLEAWVAEKQAHKEAFIAFKKVWMLSSLGQDKLAIDVDQEWSTMEALFEKETPAKVIPLNAEERRSPSTTKSKGSGWGWLRIAAAIILLAGVSVWLFNRSGNGQVQMLAKSEMVEQGLPDGSRVALNQFASLNFDNTAENRKVILEGDAFFEVARDTKHPFVITADDVQIEVLGTAFYVDARNNIDEIQVIVQSGSVAVRSGNQEVTLAANEMGIYNKAKRQLTKTSNESDNYLAWKTKELIFENTNLEAVVFALNRQYHTNISIGNPALKNCELTATYKNKSLDAVLTIIEQTLGIDVIKSGEKIVIQGSEGC